MKVTIVGGGWAGLAAAVRATQAGHAVTLLDAAPHWGGRARTLPGENAHLDNGQHILTGAYRATLDLMQTVGVQPHQVVRHHPLDLRFANGQGWAVPTWASRWPAGVALLAATLNARGWTWADKWAWLRWSAGWHRRGFRCASHLTVADLCPHLPQRPVQELLEPLCVSALNTPMHQANAQVFLRVLQDSLTQPGWGDYRACDLLVPTTDLGQLLPEPAVQWLQRQGATTRLSQRVTGLQTLPQGGWDVHTTRGNVSCDAVILACPAPDAARVAHTAAVHTTGLATWAEQAAHLAHTAIATVYVQAPATWVWPGTQAMLALPGGPAQFVFQRAALGGPAGLLAFVVSASEGTAQALQAQVLQQAQQTLGLQEAWAVRTVVEKRATFACTPGVQRPSATLAPGLWAAGDYVDGPYPATLEGAVRSGLWAAEQLPKPL